MRTTSSLSPILAPQARDRNPKADEYEFLAIVPAREGSKGLPNKNFLDLCGKPLIAYTIEALLKSRYIDRVIVTTDSERIAEISLAHGAEVPFLRPPYLAGDDSPLGEVFGHALKYLYPDGLPDNVVLATPFTTSPFRNPRLVNTMLERIMDGDQHVMTVRPIDLDCGTYFLDRGDDGLRPLIRPGSLGLGGRRRFYRPYGVFSASLLRPNPPEDPGLYNPERRFIHVLDDPIQMVDIDYPEDFHLAELIIQNGLFDFELQ